MAKIQKKFMKEHFNVKDNIIDKNLTQYIKSKQFSQRPQLTHVIEDLLHFFSEHFTNFNEKKA